MNRAILAMALATSLYAGLSQAADRNDRGLNPRETENVRHVIAAWLECHECTKRELGAVKRLGQLAVPTLAAVLKGGPSPATLETHGEHLAESYREMVDYATRTDTMPPALSEQEHLDLYTANFVAVYKIRAAEALREIGGDRAQKALDDAANDDANREDVTARLKELATRGRRR